MGQGNLFEERKFEYLIIIPPSQEISSDIKVFKKVFYDTINSKSKNRYAKAHITILNLYNSSYSEEEIITKIKKVLVDTPKIHVKVNGVEKFTNKGKTRSVVLLISEDSQIKELHKKLLYEFFIRMKKMTPHITIVKDITIQELEMLEVVISSIYYQKEFQADRLSILKREIIDEKPQAYFLVSDIMLN